MFTDEDLHLVRGCMKLIFHMQIIGDKNLRELEREQETLARQRRMLKRILDNQAIFSRDAEAVRN